MDYSIRPVDQKTPHSIAPRRKRDEERAPFDFGAAPGEAGEERRPSAQHQPAPPEERAIAPRSAGEIGAHLDLSA